MKTHILAATLLILGGTTSHAGTEFGTAEDARALATALVSIVERDGIEPAVGVMHDPEFPFRESRLGVNLFRDATVIADNREPEMVAADYEHLRDLTGELIWPLISEAADGPQDVVLKWYHYDTQEAYDYHCFSLRAARDDGLVMVCR